MCEEAMAQEWDDTADMELYANLTWQRCVTTYTLL